MHLPAPLQWMSSTGATAADYLHLHDCISSLVDVFSNQERIRTLLKQENYLSTPVMNAASAIAACIGNSMRFLRFCSSVLQALIHVGRSTEGRDRDWGQRMGG